MLYKIILLLLHVIYSIFCSILLGRMFLTSPLNQFRSTFLCFGLGLPESPGPRAVSKNCSV